MEGQRLEGVRQVQPLIRRLRHPVEESPQAEACLVGPLMAQVRVEQAQVPMAQVALQAPSLDVPNLKEEKVYQAPSRWGVGVSSSRDGEVANLRDELSNQGVEVSSRRGADPSHLEEAANGRDEVPNPAAVGLLVPNVEVVLSVPNHLAEGPIHPAVEANCQEVEAPSLRAEVGPNLVDQRRMGARLRLVVPSGVAPWSDLLLAPFSRQDPDVQARRETAELPRSRKLTATRFATVDQR